MATQVAHHTTAVDWIGEGEDLVVEPAAQLLVDEHPMNALQAISRGRNGRELWILVGGDADKTSSHLVLSVALTRADRGA
ncbi:hypothetical protein, partial [Streptomyces noursei]|uniref:hypothetical protein n=1 Tax=Streptomyces noursei TaxID=1971 RepID=UPI001E38EA33